MYTDYDLSAEFESGWYAGKESVLEDIADAVVRLDMGLMDLPDFVLEMRRLAKS